MLGRLTIILAYVVASSPCYAQMTFSNYASYCSAMSETSTPTLLARTQGMSRSEVEKTMAGMTDPVSIRMVEQLIDYAWSRPATTSIGEMRAELRSLCLARKIFAQ